MPPKARIDVLGALQHAIVRRIERRKIFRSDYDRKNLLDRVSELILQTGIECFAWAFMSNHFHLLLRTGSVPIAVLMRRLLTGYAGWFNKKYKRHGQLFQNRYKSFLCQEDIYLKKLVRYIHLNPLRAGIVVDLKALDQYQRLNWSIQKHKNMDIPICYIKLITG
jgi:putative transposase